MKNKLILFVFVVFQGYVCAIGLFEMSPSMQRGNEVGMQKKKGRKKVQAKWWKGNDV